MKLHKFVEYRVNESYNSVLNISNKNLESFPKFLPLPESLEVLSCYNNNLTSLPSLPERLERLVLEF